MGAVRQEASDHLAHALGDAVVRLWSRLPHHVQQCLFEEAISARGEPIRQQLAILLHERHPRTSASIQARAMPEPDSLGG